MSTHPETPDRPWQAARCSMVKDGLTHVITEFMRTDDPHPFHLVTIGQRRVGEVGYDDVTDGFMSMLAPNVFQFETKYDTLDHAIEAAERTTRELWAEAVKNVEPWYATKQETRA